MSHEPGSAGLAIGWLELQSAESRGHGGKRAGSGRKKGPPNRLTADVMAAIMAAFADADAKDYLVALAKSDPRTFCMLLPRCSPIGSLVSDQPIRVEFSWLAPASPEA